MGLHNDTDLDFDDNNFFREFPAEDKLEKAAHRREVRKKLEAGKYIASKIAQVS